VRYPQGKPQLGKVVKILQARATEWWCDPPKGLVRVPRVGQEGGEFVGESVAVVLVADEDECGGLNLAQCFERCCDECVTNRPPDERSGLA
jgi:hypothetical protein